MSTIIDNDSCSQSKTEFSDRKLIVLLTGNTEIK